jgi:predicted type IV restriction endonuclease
LNQSSQPREEKSTDFIDKIRELSARIPKQLDPIQTEEATKNVLVMPFISALGYNVFDPTEVTPELCADVGVKKGEKVDYAILREGKPIILFECKHHAADLGKVHASQLYRYFSVTEARFSVLTNVLVYWFYTDLQAPNKMDERPFFEFNMLDIKEFAVEELKKFSKSIFDLDYILNTASELKYTREIKRLLLDQMQEPTDEFVRFFASRVYSGRMTQGVREQFAQLTKQAFKQLLNDQINERLKTALASDPMGTAPPAVETPALQRTRDHAILCMHLAARRR